MSNHKVFGECLPGVFYIKSVPKTWQEKYVAHWIWGKGIVDLENEKPMDPIEKYSL